MSSASEPSVASAPKKQLSLLDATCIIVGIIVGAGIYEATPLVAKMAGSETALLFAWVIGGLLAFCGALCYSELSTMFPQQGGDFVYLSRAYSSWVGTLFVWIEFWIIRPGNIGAVAFVVARYLQQVLGDNGIEHFLPAAFQSFERSFIAISAVTIMTLMNLLGIQAGKWTQNVLTIIKVATLLAIFVVAVMLGSSAASGSATSPTAADQSSAQKTAEDTRQDAAPASQAKQGSESAAVSEKTESTFVLGNFALAMVFVMFSYGGWGDMTYVAAEVRNPSRNLVRALVLGTLCVMVVYILVSIAFLRGLGYERLSDPSVAPAAEFLKQHIGRHASWVASIAIGISCLGCIHGMVFAGSRIYYALGTRNAAFSWLGRWNARSGVPTRSLVVQYLATVMLVLLSGRNQDGFEKLVVFTGPFFWGFFALVGFAVIVLRYRMPQHERPYRVHLYPVLPIIFSSGCIFMLWKSIEYVISKIGETKVVNGEVIRTGYAAGAWWAAIVVAVGIVIALLPTSKPGESK